MADFSSAQTGLEELHGFLNYRISLHGFDNESVMWMVKAWSKIQIWLTGGHSDFVQRFIRNVPPAAITGNVKRSKLLLNAVSRLSDEVNNHNGLANEEGWKATRDAMVAFVHDYWQHTKGSTKPATNQLDFEGQLRAWMHTPSQAVLREEIFGMDRHA